MVAYASFRNQYPIVGRQREQEQLAAYLNRAASGDGTLVLISGEAGIGKTTLVRWLVDRAREQDMLVLSGACYDLTTTPPYGPWSEAIRDYQPAGHRPAVPAWFDNPDQLQKIGSQTALFEEARRFFAGIANEQKLLLVLEDLHWADLASLDALRYLSRTLGSASVLLVVTYRDDEVTRRHELYQLLPLLVRESQAQRIHLSQLASDDIREIVIGRYDLAEPELDRLVAHVSDRSEGNPFFAGELLQGLEDERVLRPSTDGWTLDSLMKTHLPLLLRQTLDTRLARLSSETQTALQVAAVIGQVVPVDLWHEQSGLDEEGFDRAMTEALDTHVIEEGVGRRSVYFHHALLREALYESLTVSRRRAWHCTVGEALAASNNPDPDVTAYHFLEAGDQRAAYWLIRAGLRAEGSYALQVAAEHYINAQILLDSDPAAAQARGWLLIHIGHLLRYSDTERSITYLEDAAQVARQINDPVLEAKSKATHGLLRCFQGDVGRGLSDKEDANAIMDTVTEPQEQRARQAIASLFPSEVFTHPSTTSGGSVFKIGLLPGVNTLIHTYVDSLALAGRFREAMRIGERFIDRVTAGTDDTLLIQYTCRDAYFGLSVSAHWLGQPEEARRWRALALEAYEAVGHRAMARGVRSEELVHLLTYGADRLVDRRRSAMVITTTIEGIAQHHLGGGFGVLLDLIEGRWDQAREFTSAILNEQDPYAQYLRAWIYRMLGREQRDEELIAAIRTDIQRVLPDGPATEFGQKRARNTVIARLLAADLTLDASDFEAARDWITAHDRWLDWSGAVLGRADGQLLWARYHQLAGDLDTAQRHAEQALEHASNPRQPMALIAANRALGQLETAIGQYDEATNHLQTSLDLAKRCEAPYEQALTMLEIIELAARTGDTNEARRLLQEVRTICETLGAHHSLERAIKIEKLLPRTSGDYPAGLSAREVEVLRLVAQGMTNAEIGAQLYISQRTVAQHLRSVYNKLGVNSRAAAVARFAEFGLT